MIDVKGKWALVTGSSRGIGYQIAMYMAKQGCNLILHSRSLEHTRELEEAVRALGVDCYSIQADLAHQEQVLGLLNQIEAKGTPVDIVFNNAAVQVAYREDYSQTPASDFETSFQINFITPATIAFRLIPKMRERGFGRIINTTSGIKNQPEQSAYAASKAALDKFTKDLASKLEASQVVISLADPGWIRTDMGGPNAPNDPESVVPGMVVGAFVSDTKSGRFFAAQDYKGMSLEEAVAKAESVEATPYVI